MSELHPIDPAPLRQYVGKVRHGHGDKPQLRWIAVDCLLVDRTYQRELFKQARSNVLRIAREFDWSKFVPVIVVEADKGTYLVIDGQCRTTAAALRGIRDVPCQIIVADRRQQAEAFTAINASVTRLTSQQIHHAKVAAGDEAAVALAQACEAGGVRILRYPLAANQMKAGDTLAAHQLARVFAKYGRDLFVLACRCITATGDGNAGCVRGPVVEAICAVLEAAPEFAAKEASLIDAMRTFEFAAEFDRARVAADGLHSQFASHMVDIVSEYLDARMNGARVA